MHSKREIQSFLRPKTTHGYHVVIVLLCLGTTLPVSELGQPPSTESNLVLCELSRRDRHVNMNHQEHNRSVKERKCTCVLWCLVLCRVCSACVCEEFAPCSVCVCVCVFSVVCGVFWESVCGVVCRCVSYNCSVEAVLVRDDVWIVLGAFC